MDMETEDEALQQKPDWAVGVVLIAIWCCGIYLVTRFSPEIPVSMLIVGTVFFIVLIPAMKELVRTIERAIDREVSGKRD